MSLPKNYFLFNQNHLLLILTYPNNIVTHIQILLYTLVSGEAVTVSSMSQLYVLFCDDLKVELCSFLVTRGIKFCLDAFKAKSESDVTRGYNVNNQKNIFTPL